MKVLLGDFDHHFENKSIRFIFFWKYIEFQLSYISNGVRIHYSNVVNLVQTSAQQRVYWASELINSNHSQFLREFH